MGIGVPCTGAALCIGACCRPDGSCFQTVQAQCPPPSSWRGYGSSCTPNPCPPPHAVSEDDYVHLESNLREAAHQIAERAPQARIVFIQYVTLVPRTQCANSRLSEEEAAQLRAVAARLAEITARVAQQSHARVLRMDDLSRDHTTCDAEPWSLGLPRDYQESQGAPWHPNRRGMDVIADQLRAMLAR